MASDNAIDLTTKKGLVRRIDELNAQLEEIRGRFSEPDRNMLIDDTQQVLRSTYAKLGMMTYNEVKAGYAVPDAGGASAEGGSDEALGDT